MTHCVQHEEKEILCCCPEWFWQHVPGPHGTPLTAICSVQFMLHLLFISSLKSQLYYSYIYCISASDKQIIVSAMLNTNCAQTATCWWIFYMLIHFNFMAGVLFKCCVQLILVLSERAKMCTERLLSLSFLLSIIHCRLFICLCLLALPLFHHSSQLLSNMSSCTLSKCPPKSNPPSISVWVYIFAVSEAFSVSQGPSINVDCLYFSVYLFLPVCQVPKDGVLFRDGILIHPAHWPRSTL